MESKAEAKSVGIGVGDLAEGAKSLRHARAPQERAEEKVSAEELEPYSRLFERHKGDLRAMFDDLGEDPGKALKYPPADAEDFARVYTRGGYTYVPDAPTSSRK